MTEIDRLTAAVMASPTDGALRLILADAHEEAGNLATAEWLRFDVAVGTGEFVDPFALREREKRMGARPAGMEALYDAKAIAKTGKRPVSYMHMLRPRRRR